LSNVIFKLVNKVSNNRTVQLQIKRYLRFKQLYKRQIFLDGFTILHETFHEIVKKKYDEVEFKVDYEKAYDIINWEFLLEVLRMKVFRKSILSG
jgi:hypothetical protein